MSYYLYCNSPASSVTEQKGWVGHYIKGKHRLPVKKARETCLLMYRMYTTTEFAFAHRFDSLEEAEKFIAKYQLTAITFGRVD